MPRRVNLTVMGVSMTGPHSFAVIQYGARADNVNVCVSQGECHPALFGEQVRMIAEWHGVRALAVPAIGMRSTRSCRSVDRTITDDAWAAMVPGVEIVYVPYAKATAQFMRREVEETLGRLRYSTGSSRTAWDVWRSQSMKSVVSQATAVGAAIVCAGWLVERDAQNAERARKRKSRGPARATQEAHRR